MNCNEIIKLVDGYVDGELDAVTNQQIELHLRDCDLCRQVYESQRNLVRTVATTAPYYKAPPGLREEIQSSLRETSPANRWQSGTRNARSLRDTDQSRWRPFNVASQWPWLAAAAAVVAAALIAFNLAPRPSTDRFLATQLIASHVRSLMANHLTDVASSDQHTVKPWLDAKLDFAPAVLDLGTEGFPLVGGRLDYLNDRPVAALIYQRRKHFINLFVWPAESGSSRASRILTRQGYQLLHWVDSDFNYWAVSDVNENDLQTFKQLFEKELPHR